jgi:hypothetical protein
VSFHPATHRVLEPNLVQSKLELHLGFADFAESPPNGMVAEKPGGGDSLIGILKGVNTDVIDLVERSSIA